MENAEALENLLKQKAELEQQLETGRNTYLKVLGAIDVLQQLAETSEGEAEVAETEVVEGE